MNRLVAHLLTGLITLSLVAPIPVQAQSTPTLGQHRVQAGDTLYCLGRAYGVSPASIAQTNNLTTFAQLSVGQMLTIPAVPWERIPAGPVCAVQFASPYIQAGAPAPTPAGATPASILTTTHGDFRYVVQRGNTLFRIGQWFGLTVPALKAANGLNQDVIYPGQAVLVRNIPCDPAYPGVCLPLSPPDLDCAQITASEFQVIAPDPHRFDGDGDGVGCEDYDASAFTPSVTALSPPSLPAPSICDPAYPGICIAPAPPDLDCGQIAFKRFTVLAPDPHNFDGDGDGIGCEQ